MPLHSHGFVEEYQGLVGFGLERQLDEFTLTCYLQKFSDDNLIKVLRERMSDEDLEALFNHLTRLLKSYLTEEEYHRLFLKDPSSP